MYVGYLALRAVEMRVSTALSVSVTRSEAIWSVNRKEVEGVITLQFFLVSMAARLGRADVIFSPACLATRMRKSWTPCRLGCSAI